MRLPLAPGGNQPTARLTAADVACAGLRPGDVVAEVRTGSGEQDIPAIAEEHLRPISPPAEKHDQRAALRIAAELATRNRSARARRPAGEAHRAGHHGPGDGMVALAERRQGHTQGDGRAMMLMHRPIVLALLRLQRGQTKAFSTQRNPCCRMEVNRAQTP
ncbi:MULTISPECIES: hypothetical protein [Sorangium]|uniref:hypothetical protein n=1 Tax=Sorangium TaxID=39643 RepID=UPI00101A9F99|nr:MULTISPECIES: hypothetical protein [Sorangium]